MEFQKKNYTFRGMDGFAGFRHGQEYELELGTSEADEERPAEVVIVNPAYPLAQAYHESAASGRGGHCEPRVQAVDALQQTGV